MMLGTFQDRTKFIGLSDAGFSGLAFLAELTLSIYFGFTADFVIFKDNHDALFLSAVAIILIISLGFRIVLTISAYRVFQAAAQVEINRSIVIKRVIFWRNLNILLIILYCLSFFANLFGTLQTIARGIFVVYNCSLVCYASSLKYQWQVSLNKQGELAGNKNLGITPSPSAVLKLHNIL